MTKTSCIDHNKREPILIIRKTYVDLCKGNHCSAALMSFFEYWHNIKIDMQSKAQRANEIAVRHGDDAYQDTSLYQFHTADELVDGLLCLFKIGKIRESIEQLKELGVISVHRNPNPKYKFDNTRYFLFNPDVINLSLRHDENNTSSVENSGRSVENERRSYENERRNDKNRTTITETPTETTTETTTENSNTLSAKREKTTLNADDLISLGVDKQVAQDWLSVRKAKRAPLTKTALDAMQREADKANITLAQAVAVCAENGWQGFKHDWYLKLINTNQQRPVVKQHWQMTQTERDEAHKRAAAQAKAELFGDLNIIDGVSRHVN